MIVTLKNYTIELIRHSSNTGIIWLFFLKQSDEAFFFFRTFVLFCFVLYYMILNMPPTPPPPITLLQSYDSSTMNMKERKKKGRIFLGLPKSQADQVNAPFRPCTLSLFLTPIDSIMLPALGSTSSRHLSNFSLLRSFTLSSTLSTVLYCTVLYIVRHAAATPTKKKQNKKLYIPVDIFYVQKKKKKEEFMPSPPQAELASHLGVKLDRRQSTNLANVGQ